MDRRKIALSGKAGCGKDTLADMLVAKAGFAKVSLADPLKRFLKETFQFSDLQLWGSSEYRSAPDTRFPRGAGFLSPRLALQTLGTDWGRALYEDVWVEYALRVTQEVLEHGAAYAQQGGLSPRSLYAEPPRGVVVPDARFRNEIERLKAAGFYMVRVVRPGAGLLGEAGRHASETEQERVPDEMFDTVIVNDGTVDALYAKAQAIFGEKPAPDAVGISS